jgi:phosphoglycerate dehydrogenase-like enzyme
MILVMYSNFCPSERHLHVLHQAGGGRSVHVATSEADAVAHAPAADIILGHRYLRQILPHAVRLRWFQSTAAGIDQLPADALAAGQVIVCRNPVNATSISHHAIALAWSVLRRIPRAVSAQARGEWSLPSAMLPLPSRALVLGLGAIGQEICRLLRGMGLQVRGTARRGTAEQRSCCDIYLENGEWRRCLADIDLLFLALPLGRSTRGIIGAAELARLQSHAVIVNVARGPHIDMDALVAALASGSIGGAAVDVLDPVPAPGDPLWDTPNLLITPKVAAYHPGMQSMVERFIEEQMTRFVTGQELHAIVDAFTLRDSTLLPEPS